MSNKPSAPIPVVQNSIVRQEETVEVLTKTESKQSKV